MIREDGWSEEIVEGFPLGLIVVDREMHVVHLNPAAEELTGQARPDAIGRRLPELFGPDLWSEGSALQQAMETGERVEPRVTAVRSRGAEARQSRRRPRPPAASLEEGESTEVTGAGQRGQRRLLVGAAPFREGYLLSLQEAGPFHHIEADRVSDISHDIRGPLASIHAYTELLVDGVDEGDPQLRRQFLDVIDQRARHLTDLIVNLTYLVRHDLGCLDLTRTKVSLSEATREATTACQVHARQQGVRLAIQTEGVDDQHTVLGDRDALATLLKNVITNAIKFSEAGGEVVVSLQRADEHQIVTVADSGCGIAPQDLPHVFETFYRGRNVIASGVEGSGLGLAQVKAIAGAHGGTVDLESEEGEGTRFTIRLPAEGSSSPSS